MKRTMRALMSAPLVLCTLVGSAGTALQTEKFSASFTDAYYQTGARLCDTGAVNGTWGKVPEGAAIAAGDVTTKKYMAIAANDGIAFTPSVASGRQTWTEGVSIRAYAYEKWDQIPVPTGARAAFAIYAPEDGGEVTYLGWVCSQNCWTNLYPVSRASTITLGEWQEVMVRFLKLNGAQDGYVQYWLKRSDDSGFVPLKTADGVSWLRTGAKIQLSSWNFGKVGFVGEGDLEWVSGQEPNRGLIVGVGSWYDYLYAESIYNHSKGSSWEREDDPSRIVDEKSRSYKIETGADGRSVTYVPLWPQMHPKENVEVTELEVQFTRPNDNEYIPANACARIRLVELPDETCRFACLADGQWKTNMNWTVSADAKYTVEISLLNMIDGQKFVSYRYKEGYGLEGGAYRDLFLNEPMLPGASGKTLAIDFDGNGIVHEIRGKNGKK